MSLSPKQLGQQAEDPEILQAWAKEAQRRDAEMEAGDEPGIPAEDVFQPIRRSLTGSG